MGETYYSNGCRCRWNLLKSQRNSGCFSLCICSINTYSRAQLRLGEAAASDIRKGSSRSMFSEPLSSGLAPASQILWGSGTLVLRPSLPRQPMCEHEGKALSLPPWQEAPSCILNRQGRPRAGRKWAAKVHQSTPKYTIVPQPRQWVNRRWRKWNCTAPFPRCPAHLRLAPAPAEQRAGTCPTFHQDHPHPWAPTPFPQGGQRE